MHGIVLFSFFAKPFQRHPSRLSVLFFSVCFIKQPRHSLLFFSLYPPVWLSIFFTEWRTDFFNRNQNPFCFSTPCYWPFNRKTSSISSSFQEEFFRFTCCGAASAGEKLERAVRGAREAQEDALEGGGVWPGVGLPLPQLLAPPLDARLTLSARPLHGETDTCFSIPLRCHLKSEFQTFCNLCPGEFNPFENTLCFKSVYGKEDPLRYSKYNLRINDFVIITGC